MPIRRGSEGPILRRSIDVGNGLRSSQRDGFALCVNGCRQRATTHLFGTGAWPVVIRNSVILIIMTNRNVDDLLVEVAVGLGGLSDLEEGIARRLLRAGLSVGAVIAQIRGERLKQIKEPTVDDPKTDEIEIDQPKRERGDYPSF